MICVAIGQHFSVAPHTSRYYVTNGGWQQMRGPLLDNTTAAV
jgi:hypothetical protein